MLDDIGEHVQQRGVGGVDAEQRDTVGTQHLECPGKPVSLLCCCGVEPLVLLCWIGEGHDGGSGGSAQRQHSAGGDARREPAMARGDGDERQLGAGDQAQSCSTAHLFGQFV